MKGKTVLGILAGCVVACSLLVTCNVGLGAAVDTKPPEIAITSPEIDSHLKGPFTLSGTVSDDIALSGVQVVFDEQLAASETGTPRSYSFSAQVNAAEKTWSIALNTPEAGIFPIADGNYKITATAIDTARRSSIATTGLKVDNTAPTVLLTSPLTWGAGLFQPVFYRVIDLKGEVYDANTLSSVTVSLYGDSGNLLSQKIADGTNTWSVRFADADVTSFTDDQVIYYSVVARDLAGNTNTRYFHRFDVYPLLTATSGYVVFPSMNQIGRLETGKITEAEGLTAAELDGIAYAVASHADAPSFRFRTQESNKVQWLNITGATSAIGIGVPVVGTILPAIDGSSIDPDFIEFTIYRKSDTSLSNPIEQNVVSLSAVGASINFEVQPRDEMGIDLSSGNYLIYLEYRTSSGLEVTTNMEFGITSGLPVLRETLVGGLSSPLLATRITALPVTLGGTSTSSDGNVAIAPEYSVNGGAQTGSGVTIDASGNWTLPVSAPSDGSNDGTWTYILSTTEGGLSTTLSRIIVVDTQSPVLTVNSPAAGQIMSGAGGQLSFAGTADDGSGSGVSTVYYKLGTASDDFSAEDYTLWDVASGTIVWTAAIDTDGMPEGNKNLFFAVEDSAGNTVRLTRAFSFDRAPPQIANLEISGAPLPATVYSVNSGFTLTFDALDSNRLKSYTINRNGTNLAGHTAVDISASGTSHSVSLAQVTGSLPGQLADGEHTYVFTVVDASDTVTTVQRTVFVDTQAPVLTVTAPLEGEGVSTTSYTIRGTVDDGAGRGVQSLQYSLDSTDGVDGTWIDIPRAAAWSVPGVDFSAGGQGAKSFRVRASDGTNAATVVPVSFSYDTESPVLSVTGITGTAQVIRSASYSLVLSANDTNALKSVVIGATRDGVSQGNRYSWTAPDTSTTTHGYTYTETIADSSKDGLWVYTITVTDQANRTVSTTRTVLIDTINPAAPVFTSSQAGYVTTSLSVAGTAVDGGSGVQTVYYRLNGNAGDPETGTLTGTDNWFGTIPVPDTLAQGAYTVYVWTVDRAGNESAEANQSFVKDTENPAIAVAAGYTGTVYRSAAFNLQVTVTDTRLLGASPLSVTLSAPGAASVGTITTTTNTDQTKVFTVPIVLGSDGMYTITLNAVDASGRSATTDTRTVIVDRTDPAVSLVTVNGGNSATFTNWKGTAALTLAGTATDAGSGVALVEYSLDNSNWNALSGTTSWTGSIPVVNGTNTLYVRATDAAGRVGSLAPVSIPVDLTAPELTITSPASQQLVNGQAALVALMSASDTGGSGVASVLVKIGSTNFASPDTTATLTGGTATNGSWSATIPAATLNALTSGQQYTVNVRATDAVGKIVTSSFSILVDKTNPTVSIASPDDLSTLNRLVTISGSGNDTQVLSQVRIDVQRADLSWETIQTFNGSAAYNWSIANLNTETYGVAAYRSPFTLRATATDSAGNTATDTNTYTIDQNADRPEVRLANVRLDGTTTLKMTGTIFGSVSDDDGVPSSVSISTNGTTWVATTYANGSWEYEMPAGDGLKTVYFRVVDSTGKTFSTNAASDLDKPYLKYGVAAAETRTSISFRVDTVTPEIDSNIRANGITLVNGTAFGGGAANTVVFAADATDANGVTTLTVEVEGLSPVGTTKTGNTFTTGSISLNAPLSDGNKTVTFTATDTSGLVSTATRTIRVDNTAPTATHQTPLLGSTVNGDVELKGLADDGTGAGIASIKYKVGKDADIAPGAAGWTDVTAMGVSWRIDFKGVNTINQFANATYGTETAPSSELWEVPFMLRIEDLAGNVTVTNKTTYTLVIDPSGDKPKTTIVYPDPLAANRTLGGTIRIFGTSEDDDGVGSVWMQIDVNNDGIMNASDTAGGTNWYNGGNGQQVSGTVSWNRSINTLGEFNPAGEGVNTIQFRVRARDIYGVDGNWSAWQRIDVDKNVPKIGSSEPLIITQGAVEQTYVTDMYIKGDWVFEGSIEDESGIDSILISGDISGSLAANEEWFEDMGPAGTGRNWRMKIPVNTSALTTGRLSFTVRVYDKSSPQMESSISVSINYDNEAPTLNAYTGTTPIQQSNNTYTLSSGVNESGSGFERVVFWFQRNDGANSRVYNPMESKALNANRTMLNTLDTATDGIPRLSISGATRSTTRTLSHASIQSNLNVREGGIITIGGIDRLIVDVNHVSGTVEWADEIPTTVTTATIPYVLVVDNQTVETPVWAGDTLVSITLDDGDGMVESVERSGGLYSWTASIDARNIPDGPIVLHYVAFDKAGNRASGSVTTNVRNNPPLLASIILGTDLDGIDGVTDDEKVPSFSALDGDGKKQAAATVLSSAFIAKGDTRAEISVVGGNGPLQYALTETTTSSTVHALVNGNLRPTEASGISAVNITRTQLAALGDGNRTFVFTIWDTTELTTPGTNSLSAVLTVPMVVDVTDGVAPVVVIDPFYWNSETDNSVYIEFNDTNNNWVVDSGETIISSARDNGHIRIGVNAYGDTDDKVSGKIRIRGSAYDDQRLESLFIRMDNLAMTGTTGTYHGLVHVRAAVRQGDGTWLGVDEWNDEGWNFRARSVSFGQGGHRIEWILELDTERSVAVAGLDRTLSVVAVDRGANNSSAVPVISDDFTVENIPSKRVDVVPYIRVISTQLSQALPSNPTTLSRTALGRYPVRRGESILIDGFNFAATGNAITINSQDMGTVDKNGEGVLPLTIPGDAESGELVVTSASIPSVNNEDGGMLEPNNANNNRLDDSRHMDIWAMSPIAGTAFAAYPVMRVNPITNAINFSFGITSRFYMLTGAGGTVQNWERAFNDYNWTNLGYDTAGNVYAISSNASRGGDSLNAGARANFHSRTRNTADTTGDNASHNVARRRNLESNWNDTLAQYDPRRTQSFDMKVRGAGTVGDPARVYLVYLDNMLGQVKYRYASITGSDTITGSIQNFYTGVNPTYTYQQSGSAAGAHIIGTTAVSVPALGVIDAGAYSGTAVIAWYDTSTLALLFKYNQTPLSGSAAEWSAARELDTFAGQEVSIATDSDGGIHIAYHKASTGELKYAYMETPVSDPQIVVVDSYLSVGTNLMIQVRSESGMQVPYISYYFGSLNGTTSSLKLAYRNTEVLELTHGAVNDLYTEAWEVTSLPTNVPPRNFTVSNGFSSGNLIIGYATSNGLETARRY